MVLKNRNIVNVDFSEHLRAKNVSASGASPPDTTMSLVLTGAKPQIAITLH